MSEVVRERVARRPGERPRVLLLNRHELPPEVERLASLAEFETVEDARLEEQLRSCDVVYAWDYFWDRSTDRLARAWGPDVDIAWFHIANVGVDKLAFLEGAPNRPTITNASGVYERAIAEYVLGSYLFLLKRFRLADRCQSRRQWHRFEGGQAEGSSATVLGAGPIGREIAGLLEAIGMRVSVMGRTARRDERFGLIHGGEDLPRLLAASDLVVLAAPLTPETRRLIGAEELDLLGPDGYLVNVGRGELVQDRALIDALREGRIAGAALDVFSEEPLPESSPYWGLENCLVSSHLSGATTGWRQRLAAVFAGNLRAFRDGRPLTNVVAP